MSPSAWTARSSPRRCRATTIRALADRLRARPASRACCSAGEEYEALSRPLVGAGDRDPLAAGPVALILRSRTEQLQSLQAIHTGLAVTAVLAVALATLLSFAVARTIARRWRRSPT